MADISFITAREPAAVISRWTGIPVSRLREGKREKRSGGLPMTAGVR